MWRVALAGAVAIGLTASHPAFAQNPTASPSQTHDHGAGHGSAGHVPPRGAPTAAANVPHHTLVQTYEKAFEENVASGLGFGMAFAADQNGYPGPLHVLELKDRLKLTADQEARMQTMLAAMFAESRPQSVRLLASEAKLRQLFASGRADEASVRTVTAEVEKARAEARLVHLLFHLKTREVLTDEQRRLYHEARWGEHGSMRVPNGAPAPPK